MRFDEWASARTARAPFELEIAGEGKESALAHVRCGYFEWACGEVADGAMHTIHYSWQSPDAVLARVDGVEVEVPVRRMRPYLQPLYEREVPHDDATLPAWLRAELAPDRRPVVLVEHGLVVGRRYFARLRDEGYHLPPPIPGMPMREAHNRVLEVSDRPFGAEGPQGERTPAFRGWTY